MSVAMNVRYDIVIKQGYDVVIRVYQILKKKLYIYMVTFNNTSLYNENEKYGCVAMIFKVTE